MLVHKAFTQSRTNAGTVLFDCMLIYQSDLAAFKHLRMIHSTCWSVGWGQWVGIQCHGSTDIV